jgi:hypothetical protein
MEEYEIRILSAAMQPTRSVFGMFENADEAVLEARRCAMAKRSRSGEIAFVFLRTGRYSQ